MKAPATPGMKFDDGKLPHHLFPLEAEAEVLAVLGFGAVKYEPWNWRDVPGYEERYYDAALRHLKDAKRGKVLDAEMGLLSLAAAATNVIFLLAKKLETDPELALTLPGRYRAALDTAKRLREERLALAEAAELEDLAPLASGRTWCWKLRSKSGRTLGSGTEPSQAEALRKATELQRKKKIASAEIVIDEVLPPAEEKPGLKKARGRKRQPAPINF